MARPQPIVLPTAQDGFGQDIGQALGTLFGQSVAKKRQQQQEEEAQQQFVEQFGSIFQQPVPQAGPPTAEMAAVGEELPQIPGEVPPQVQGLIQVLGATERGRGLGEQQAAAALKGLLAPAKPGERKIIKDIAGKQRFVDTGEEVFSGVIKPEEKVGVSEVQSSSMLSNGLVQIVRKDGTTELVKPTDADKALIQVAESRGAELQGLRASERTAAKNAQKVSIDSFKQLASIRKSISTMDEGIAAIDAGAKSGVVQKRLPTIRDASLKLKNVQARMGLDVIQNTTFGSLSAEELKFALSAALPEDLDEVSLRSWLVQKKEAQRKLSAYIEEAAIFLGSTRTDEKGIVRVNKIADFIKLKRGQQGQAPPPAGGEIEFLGFE